MLRPETFWDTNNVGLTDESPISRRYCQLSKSSRLFCKGRVYHYLQERLTVSPIFVSLFKSTEYFVSSTNNSLKVNDFVSLNTLFH